MQPYSLLKVTALLAMAAILGIAGPGAAELTPTDLHPADATLSDAYGINGAGQVAGICYYYVFDEEGNVADWYMRAVMWDSTGAVTVLDPEGLFGNTAARAIGDGGQVVGTIGDYGEAAFIWDSTNGMVDMGALYHDGVRDWDIYPAAVNANGWVIGTSNYDMPPYVAIGSWLYRNGAMEAVTDAEGNRVSAYAINDLGQVAGASGVATDGRHPAVLWERDDYGNTTVTNLTPGQSGRGVAINNSSEVLIEIQWDDLYIWRDGAKTRMMLTGSPEWVDGGWVYPRYYDGQVFGVGIDDSGRAYGYAVVSPDWTTVLWVWQDGVVTECAVPDGVSGLYNNNSGQMAGLTGGMAPFLWTAGDPEFQVLPGLGGGNVFVSGLNDNGDVVGRSDVIGDLFNPFHACVWRATSPNQAPALDVSAAPTTGVVGVPITFTATATDPDAGDTLTFSLVNAPTGASIDPATGVFTWTVSGAGAISFDVIVTDAAGATDTETVTINVSALAVSPQSIVRRGKTITLMVRFTNRSIAAAVTNATVTVVDLGGVSTTSRLPLSLGTLKAGGSKTCTLKFSGEAVPPGTATLSVQGACSQLGGFFTNETVAVP